MTKKLNIVKSKTEPNKEDLWLTDEGIKKFGTNGFIALVNNNEKGNNTNQIISQEEDLIMKAVLTATNSSKLLTVFGNYITSLPPLKYSSVSFSSDSALNKEMKTVNITFLDNQLTSTMNKLGAIDRAFPNMETLILDFKYIDGGNQHALPAYYITLNKIKELIIKNIGKFNTNITGNMLPHNVLNSYKGSFDTFTIENCGLMTYNKTGEEIKVNKLILKNCKLRMLDHAFSGLRGQANGYVKLIIENCDFSNLTNFSYIFPNAFLDYLDASPFFTNANVINDYAFARVNKLEIKDVTINKPGEDFCLATNAYLKNVKFNGAVSGGYPFLNGGTLTLENVETNNIAYLFYFDTINIINSNIKYNFSDTYRVKNLVYKNCELNNTIILYNNILNTLTYNNCNNVASHLEKINPGFTNLESITSDTVIDFKGRRLGTSQMDMPKLKHLNFKIKNIENTVFLTTASKLTDKSIKTLVDGLVFNNTGREKYIYFNIEKVLNDDIIQAIKKKKWTIGYI